MDNTVATIFIPIIKKFLVEDQQNFAPILVCQDNDEAKERLEQIRNHLGGELIEDRELDFSISDRDGVIFVIAQFKDNKTKCTNINSYCPVCGIFHWQLPTGMNETEQKEYKKEQYGKFQQSISSQVTA